MICLMSSVANPPSVSAARTCRRNSSHFPQRHHGADHQHAAGALVEMRAGPDLGPDVARDHVLEFGVERILPGIRLVDPGVAQHLAAQAHAARVAFLVVHGFVPWMRYDCRNLSTVSA